MHSNRCEAERIAESGGMDIRMIKLQIIGWRIRQKVRDGIQILKDDSGLSVIEMLLILVVIIALVLIFKTQLTNLVNTIFQKITSESSGI